MIRAVKEGRLGDHGRITSHRVSRVPIVKTIIAMKGIPYSCKSEIGYGIGQWAKCPVVSVDDFLQAVSMDKGYTAESPPSPPEEAERLRHLALYALYKTAGQHIRTYDCVVIKSRLCCLFELDLLIWLAKETKCRNILIVECKAKYGYSLKERVAGVVSSYKQDKSDFKQRRRDKDIKMHRLKHRQVELYGVQDEWYKARDWKDVDNARDEYHSPVAEAEWEDRLLKLLSGYESGPLCVVTRLVVDPFNDLTLEGAIPGSELPPDFIQVIALLLERHVCFREVIMNPDAAYGSSPRHYSEEEEEGTEEEYIEEESTRKAEDEDEDEEEGTEEECCWEDDGTYSSDRQYQIVVFNKLRLEEELYSRERQYQIIQFIELRRSLVKIELSKSNSNSKKSRYLCNTTEHQSCVFKYWNMLPSSNGDGDGDDCCGVCEGPVYPGKPAYACHFCILTLHVKCATLLDLNFLEHTQDRPGEYVHHFPYARSLTRHQDKEACKSCVEADNPFSDECISCLFQTHLKLKLLPTVVNHDSHPHPLSIRFTAKQPVYDCYICKFKCEVVDVLLPRQVHDRHGCHDHVMKLKYSLEGMAPELDHWCHRCYKDVSPSVWIYSCLQCPFYVCKKHAFKRRLQEAIVKRELAIQNYEPICKFARDMLKNNDTYSNGDKDDDDEDKDEEEEDGVGGGDVNDNYNGGGDASNYHDGCYIC